MQMTFGDRLVHAWNAFTNNRDPTSFSNNSYYGTSYGTRPDRTRLSLTNERSIVSAVYNRIAIDVAAVGIKHVRVDQNGSYLETVESSLNERLSMDANIDQTGRELILDAVMSMMDEGCIAIIPTRTNIDPEETGGFKIEELRVGKILQWFPKHIRAEVYNQETGQHEEITIEKRHTAIIENPLYAVMNEPNSTLKRLIRKLNLLDAVDEQSSSGKLDIIVQLPYTIKTPAKKAQADERRKDIEMQLSGSKYGIAYIDGTEKVTQLNRPADNNLMAQIEYLTSMLFSQLGITQSIFDGTADEATKLDYYNRTIEPILSAITDKMTCAFLTKTARTQKQRIIFIRDPFKLVPVSQLAEIADKFTRNEILTSNEVRALMGIRPSEDPKANELRNKNLNQKGPEYSEPVTPALPKQVHPLTKSKIPKGE